MILGQFVRSNCTHETYYTTVWRRSKISSTTKGKFWTDSKNCASNVLHSGQLWRHSKISSTTTGKFWTDSKIVLVATARMNVLHYRSVLETLTNIFDDHRSVLDSLQNCICSDCTHETYYTTVNFGDIRKYL